ncbi:MAG TPA: AAA family ATPase [Candidatus Omnitrophota bacterium]|nr:AAA family ATPase [Candidatus Omnitrophota bacterium]
MIKTRMFLAAALVQLLLLQPVSFGAVPSARGYFNSASYKYLTGDLDGALRDLRSALKINPRYAGASRLMKNVLSDIQETRGTTEAPVVLTKTRIAKEYITAGKVHLDRKELPEAKVFFEGALSVDPGNGEALKYLDDAKGRIKAAEEESRQHYREEAIKLAAWFFGSVLLLALFFLAIKKFLAARDAAEKKAAHCFKCGSKLPPNAENCPNCGAHVGLKVWNTISTEQRMWYEKLKWRSNPFTLDIYPELFTGYKDEVKSILEKISAESGHILITGPLGIGKTTLLRWLANYLSNEFHPVYISRPPQEFKQVIKLIVQSMGIDPKKAEEYDLFTLDKLRRKINKSLILLLDEAHEFTIEIERPLRTLGDMDRVKLVMAGLPETSDKIKNEIKPLYERLVLEIDLNYLEPGSLRELIRIRIENAGGEGTHPFTAAALDKVHELSGGNPRIALKICDWSVTRAINLGEDKITDALVSEYRH